MPHSKDCLFFKVLAEDLVFGAAKVSKDGKFLWVNRSLEEILEYTQLELTEKTWMELTHPADLRIDQAMIQKIMNGERGNYAMTKRFITKSGKIIWVSLYVSKVEGDETFSHFVSQLIPMTPLQSSQLIEKTETPTPHTGSLWQQLVSGWGVIAAVIAGVALILAELIRLLKSH